MLKYGSPPLVTKMTWKIMVFGSRSPLLDSPDHVDSNGMWHVTRVLKI